MADADRFANRFNATRIIHDADKDAMPECEWIVEGDAIVQVAQDFQIIPVPGHTAGSQALLYQKKYLFSGDHLWWESDKERLGMPSRLVWNAPQLLQSTQRLLDFSFEWILPGHGDRIHLSSTHMQRELKKLLEKRQVVSVSSDD